MTLTPEEFYVFNEQTKTYQVPEGDFLIQVGGSSDQLPLKAKFILGKSVGKPDFSVKNIRTIPAFPKEGEEVIFMASLINNGTAASKKGEPHIVRFFVDGKEVAWYSSASVSIPAGGMEQVCAQGMKGNWKASGGNFRVTATIEVAGDKDLNISNNACEGVITIPGGKVIPVEIAKMIN